MNAARRGIKRRDWPRGLREPRPGYFVWEPPGGEITINGERKTCLVIGSVSYPVARNEAIAANAHVLEIKRTLLSQLTAASSEGRTVADLLKLMPAGDKPNTAKSWRSLDKTILAGIGTRQAAALTVADCAGLLNPIIEAGKSRSAQAVRSRLVSVCAKGMAQGWMTANPATVTEDPRVVVKRGRLTLDAFKAIYAKAPEVAEWLQHAMALALVTGADRATIAGLQRADVADGYLTFARIKTGVRVAVPLRLRLDALDWTLADLVARKSGVISPLLVHHINPWGNAPAGSAVHPDRISHSFTEARRLAGIEDDGAPTFHELRSLAKRLYEEQGGVDTRALLGHKTERMSDLYANPRGVEAIRVRVA